MEFQAESESVPLTVEQEAGLKQIAIRRCRGDLAKIVDGQSDADAFAYLPRAAVAAFHLGEFEHARRFAERALALAPSFNRNWNYGNALHLGHTVLGLLAIKSGDIPAAVAELARSAETPGSPQLNTFGPTMQLAKAVLRAGESEPVLEYVRRVRNFWEMGTTWLDLREQKITSGQVPNCFQHSFA